MFQQRRNSAAAVPDWRDPRFSSNASKNFGGAQGNPFYGQQLQSSGQPFSINNSDSNNYSRANATLPPIRSSSTAPFSQPNSIRPGARPPSPTGSFRFLSLSNGPASPTSMPYYSQSSFSYTPSAPRSSGAPQMPVSMLDPPTSINTALLIMMGPLLLLSIFRRACIVSAIPASILGR